MQMRRVWAEAPDNSGSPSADGRLLSFVDWETGDVAIRDLGSKNGTYIGGARVSEARGEGGTTIVIGFNKARLEKLVG